MAVTSVAEDQVAEILVLGEDDIPLSLRFRQEVGVGRPGSWIPRR